ncbi:MAG: F0F1 ATP synthase subunit delta [Treponema sp.]|jgi:F0F1-type ATP synthase delta subunit|nr:F0F1 ATP synthase subunit delta [Treponema sp.]
MFNPERWAEAFLAVLDSGGGADISGDAAEGLEVLRVLEPVVGGTPFALGGYAHAQRLGEAIRSALKTRKHGRGAEAAAGLVLLLVEKNVLKHIVSVTAEIEKMLDERNGVLTAVLESAAPVSYPAGDGFIKSLKEILCGKTGAKDVHFDLRPVPELLGGYRLRAGGVCVDASLRGFLRSMSSGLSRGNGDERGGGRL